MKYNTKVENPLLEVLVLYTRYYHKPFTKEFLINGLPTPPGKKTPELYSEDTPRSLFLRAAQHAGLKSRLVQKDLETISKLVLPVILLLKKKQACILSAIDPATNMAEVIFANGKSQQISITNLNKAYSGKLFMIKRKLLNKFLPPSDNTVNKHWFWDIVSLSRSSYIDAFIATFLLNVFVLATPLFIMNVYDRVIPNNSFDTLWMFSLGLIFIYVFEMIVSRLRTTFIELAARKTDVIISSEIFNKILDMNMDNRPKSSGSFSSMIKDFDYLRNFMATSSMTVLVDLPFLFLFLFVMYLIGGEIVFIPLSVMLLILLYIFFKRHIINRYISQTRSASAFKQGILVENLNALETVKSLNIQNNAQFEWEEASGENAHNTYVYKAHVAAMNSMVTALARLNIIAVIIAGSYFISINEMTTGGLFALIILTRRVVASVGKIVQVIQGYYQAKTSYELIDQLMCTEIEHPKNKNFIPKEYFEGKIEFKNVSFSYKNNPKEILNNVSFTINPGEKVAFLGDIGSGKSTALKLILGLYTPSKGDIYIDDLDISQIDPNALRSNIGYVAQETLLFHGTLKENIMIKNPEANDTQILHACKISGADDIIKKHPQGFEMMISERGENLSHGQRQCIGITRILLNDHPIYLLDEPTSSIDSKHEKRLIEKLVHELADKTVIVVTHRRPLLSMVDKIILFHNGEIFANDSKESILKNLG